MIPPGPANNIYLNISPQGYTLTQGQLNPDRVLENLQQIEKVLFNNVKYISVNDDTPSLGPSEAIDQLAQLAKSNRDFLINYIKTDTVLDRAWNHVTRKDQYIDTIFNRIERLVSIHKNNFKDEIETAKQLGWKGGDKEAVKFIFDLEKTVTELAGSKIINPRDVVRSSVGKIDLIRTVENIKKSKLSDQQYEKLLGVRENYLRNDIPNQYLQLGILFGHAFPDFTYEKLVFDPVSYGSRWKDSLNEVASYVDDFTKIVDTLLIQHPNNILEILSKLAKIPIVYHGTALSLFRVLVTSDAPEDVKIGLLQRLKKGGVNFNDKIFDSEPLQIAIEKNNLPFFKFLIEQGANIDTDSKGLDLFRSLYRFVNSPPKYDFLIEVFKLRPDLARSTEENHGKYHGTYALKEAISDGKTEEALKLIDVGVNINGKMNDPIIQAMFYGNHTVFDALLSKGVDLTDKSVFGGTMISHAIMTNGASFIKKLVAAGVEINAKEKSGDNHLHQLINRQPEYIQGVVELIRNGIDVNAKDVKGNTPLHLAMMIVPSNLQILELLLNAGADPLEPNNLGTTALVMANKLNHPAINTIFTKKRTQKLE